MSPRRSRREGRSPTARRRREPRRSPSRRAALGVGAPRHSRLRPRGEIARRAVSLQFGLGRALERALRRSCSTFTGRTVTGPAAFSRQCGSLFGTGAPEIRGGPLSRGRLLPDPDRRVPVTTSTATRFCAASVASGRYVAGRPASAPKRRGTRYPGLIRQHQFDKVELVRRTSGGFFRGARSLTAHAEECCAAQLPTGSSRSRPGTSVLGREDLRHRGLAPRPGRVPRDLLMLELHGFPGAPRQHPVPPRREREAGVPPHVERLRARDRPDDRRDPRERSARGRLGRDPGGAGAVHGRSDHDRPPLTPDPRRPSIVGTAASSGSRRIMNNAAR